MAKSLDQETRGEQMQCAIGILAGIARDIPIPDELRIKIEAERRKVFEGLFRRDTAFEAKLNDYIAAADIASFFIFREAFYREVERRSRMMQRVWNGRHQKYFRTCHPLVERYVTHVRETLPPDEIEMRLKRNLMPFGDMDVMMEFVRSTFDTIISVASSDHTPDELRRKYPEILGPDRKSDANVRGLITEPELSRKFMECAFPFDPHVLHEASKVHNALLVPENFTMEGLTSIVESQDAVLRITPQGQHGYSYAIRLLEGKQSDAVAH